MIPIGLFWFYTNRNRARIMSITLQIWEVNYTMLLEHSAPLFLLED